MVDHPGSTALAATLDRPAELPQTTGTQYEGPAIRLRYQCHLQSTVLLVGEEVTDLRREQPRFYELRKRVLHWRISVNGVPPSGSRRQRPAWGGGGGAGGFGRESRHQSICRRGVTTASRAWSGQPGDGHAGADPARTPDAGFTIAVNQPRPPATTPAASLPPPRSAPRTPRDRYSRPTRSPRSAPAPPSRSARPPAPARRPLRRSRGPFRP